jgi:hypothetical protein
VEIPEVAKMPEAVEIPSAAEAPDSFRPGTPAGREAADRDKLAMFDTWVA